MRSFIQFALAFASLFLFVHADFWMGDIAHQGLAPYAGSGYAVFRNVKDYGAVGMSSTSPEVLFVQRVVNQPANENY